MLCHRKSRKVAACRVRLSRWKCLSGTTEEVRGSTVRPGCSPPPPRAVAITCVGQQGLERGLHAFVRQQLLRGLVLQEHAQHGLGFVAMPRVGVPRDAEAQQGLCR